MLKTVLPLLLVCVVSTDLVQGQTLTEPTEFEVSGTDEGLGAYSATVRITPTPPGVLVERDVLLRDGTRSRQWGRGTQEPYRVRASLRERVGISGRLGESGGATQVELVLAHDGAGRCRSQVFAGERRLSLARGGAAGVTSKLDVAIISDLNGSYGSTSYGQPVRAAVTALTDRWKPDLVLVTGDMVAGQLKGWGSTSNHARLERTCRAMWRSFHSTVTNPLQAAGIPLVPAPGNHDASHWRPRERAIYADAWKDRVHVEFVDGTQFPFRYTFVKGGVFFLAMDATKAGRLDTLEWVKDQLGSPRAQACALRIAYGHFPLHPTAETRRTAILHDSVEEVFAANDVSLYAAGHHHAYYPGAGGGVRQVVMACLGGGPRPLLGQDRRSPRNLVMLQIRGGELTALEAFGGSALDQRVDRDRLPARLGALTRDDRAGFSSTWTAPGAAAVGP